jgi:hypothetical protein
MLNDDGAAKCFKILLPGYTKDIQKDTVRKLSARPTDEKGKLSSLPFSVASFINTSLR